MTKKINDTACPFCTADNQCQVEGSACWCFDVEAPKALVSLAAEYFNPGQCICLACINKYNKNPVQFMGDIKSIQK